MLGLPVVHLDQLYWHPGWQPTPAPEWRHIVEWVVAEDLWIIDGNYSGTLDLRLPPADTVVFLDFPRRTSLAGVMRRLICSRGRPIQAPGCPERVDLAFLRWVWNYPKQGRQRVIQALERYGAHSRLIVLANRREVRCFVDSVSRRGNVSINEASIRSAGNGSIGRSVTYLAEHDPARSGSVVVPTEGVVPPVVEQLVAAGYQAKGARGVAGREAFDQPPGDYTTSTWSSQGPNRISITSCCGISCAAAPTWPPATRS